jgi:hypothetical protein
MTIMVKVTGTDFVRDINSMGLSNINPIEKEEYLLKKKLIQAQKSEINNMKSEINSIKTDVSDIKQLLLQLMDKG